MPNTAPTLANLSGDSVAYAPGAVPVRLDAGTAAAVSDPDPFGFEVRRVGAGFGGGPLFTLEVPDGTGRMFVVEKAGTIRILDPATGIIDSTNFLNVGGEIATDGEQGLLGFALAPNFASSGIFYIYMTNLNGDNEVRRYHTLAADPDQADPASGDRILLIPHPNVTNHNAGWIAFGPDGNLYITTGDAGVGANAQSVNTLLGKVLRIDPAIDAFPADPDRDYAIPAGNPFAGAIAGRDEIWALGLRNPFRANFDSANGNLWIADVGEARIEEIDLAPAGMGGLNFGWNVREGTLQQTGPNSPAFTPPLAEYGHGTGPFEGNSITGGLVYHGPIAGLDGQYVFGDFFDELWSIPTSALAQGSTLESDGFILRNTAFRPDAGTINQITSFSTDSAGRIYITDLGGEVFRVQPSATPNFAGGSLTVHISAGEVAGEDQLGLASGTVTLSDGTNFGSEVRVGGVLVGTVAPGGSGLDGEDLVILFSSGATAARISSLVQAVTYSNNAADATTGARTIAFTLHDGAGTAGGGHDTVVATTTVNVQGGLVLSGTPGDDALQGSGGDDVIRTFGGVDTLDGLGGNDALDGGGGADEMTGGLGNDLFFVDNAGDETIEAAGGGRDKVYANIGFTLATNVEDLTLQAAARGSAATGNGLANVINGNGFNNVLRGLDGNDSLIGNAGNDTLQGGFGADTMSGGADADTFWFTTALGPANIDRILDFQAGVDDMILENSVFGALPTGALAAGAFRAGTAAADGDDRIIYNSASGALLYDADGTGAGAAVQFATVQTGLALGAGDFIVI